MRLKPQTKDEWFRADRLAAVVLTTVGTAAAAVLAADKFWINPSLDWRGFWVPIACIACAISMVWGQVYLSRKLNRRRELAADKGRRDQIA